MRHLSGEHFFRKRQELFALRDPSALDRGLARDRRGQPLPHVGGRERAPLPQLFHQLFEQRHGGGGIELRRHGADEECGVAEGVQLKAEARHERGVRLQQRRAVRVGGEGLRL